MNDYATSVKDTLFTLIHELDQISCLFSQNPESDFKRNRKLGFESLIKFLLSMEGGSLSKEILEYFQYDSDTATVSAFNQQRKKLMPEALEFLFHEFNAAFSGETKYQGYTLLACDGSDINISRNPDDKDTYFQSTPDEKGFNQLHLNALYDVLERRYTDVLIQPARKENEYRAMTDMIDRSKIEGKVIVMADRGYESYNIFAHAEKKGWNYLMRVKDINSSGMVSSYPIPNQQEFDITVEKVLTRKQTKVEKADSKKYKFIPKNSTFDYLDLVQNKYYPIAFRIVRFKISEDTYECIITNLDKEQFPAYVIKKLYHMRWSIETSFRELKYAIGLSHFHSKKVAYITQEIFVCTYYHVQLLRTDNNTRSHTSEYNKTYISGELHDGNSYMPIFPKKCRYKATKC